MNPSGLAEGLAAFFARHPLRPQSRQRDDAVADLGGMTPRRKVRRDPTGAGAPAVPMGRGARSEAQETPPVAAPGPVKFVALYGSPSDATAFERYYAETHVPLARRLPGLQRLETARLLGTAEGGPAPYYRIAELRFADMEHLQAAAASPAGQALAADVAKFATGGVTVLVVRVDEDGAAAMVGTPVT
jgi:uncharacterized protein (TIGR02118 family)